MSSEKKMSLVEKCLCIQKIIMISRPPTLIYICHELLTLSLLKLNEKSELNKESKSNEESEPNEESKLNEKSKLNEEVKSGSNVENILLHFAGFIFIIRVLYLD